MERSEGRSRESKGRSGGEGEICGKTWRGLREDQGDLRRDMWGKVEICREKGRSVKDLGRSLGRGRQGQLGWEGESRRSGRGSRGRSGGGVGRITGQGRMYLGSSPKGALRRSSRTHAHTHKRGQVRAVPGTPRDAGHHDNPDAGIPLRQLTPLPSRTPGIRCPVRPLQTLVVPHGLPPTRAQTHTGRGWPGSVPAAAGESRPDRGGRGSYRSPHSHLSSVSRPHRSRCGSHRHGTRMWSSQTWGPWKWGPKYTGPQTQNPIDAGP